MGDVPTLTVSLTGKGVRDGTMRADRLATVLEDLQGTINRIGLVVTGKSSVGRSGAFPKEIKEACALSFVGVRMGSVSIDLELVASPSLDHEGLGERSVQALVDGIVDLESGEIKVPKHFDMGVLEGLNKLTGVMDEDVERISFDLRERGRVRRASLNRDRRTKLSKFVKASTKETMELTGDLRLVDLERSKCQLYLPEGGHVKCTFPIELATDLAGFLGRRIALHGIIERRVGTDVVLEFKIVDVLGDVESAYSAPGVLTARALLDAGLSGIWADRVDAIDPVTYADELRRRAGRRRD